MLTSLAATVWCFSYLARCTAEVAEDFVCQQFASNMFLERKSLMLYFFSPSFGHDATSKLFFFFSFLFFMMINKHLTLSICVWEGQSDGKLPAQ